MFASTNSTVECHEHVTVCSENIDKSSVVFKNLIICNNVILTVGLDSLFISSKFPNSNAAKIDSCEYKYSEKLGSESEFLRFI